MPSEMRISLALEFEKNLSFNKLKAARLKGELTKPFKNKWLRAKLSRENLHHNWTGRIGGRFEFLEKGATYPSCLVIVMGHSKNCGPPL
jgi:hypothetical protein